MKTVSFQNKGLIDHVSIRTFGVNVKENPASIGFFGTGLKYAIAILLRNGCKIDIYRGMEWISFSTKTETIRGKDFELVCMNGEPMGFTLELGKTWELWQAFRELYCNTLDERGETYSGHATLEEDCTTVIVTGEAFYAEYMARDKIVLSTEPQYVLSDLEIHDNPSVNAHFQGIRVMQLDRPSIFTYNVLGEFDLTEDRTAKTPAQLRHRVCKAVVQGKDKDLIERFLCAPEETYEAKMDVEWHQTPSDEFMQVVAALPFKHITNASALSVYRRHVRENKCPDSVDALTNIEEQQLKKAIDFCHGMQFPVDKFPISVTEDLQDKCLGMAYGRQIYVARRTFMMGTKMVASTLIEEYLHIEKDFVDCTYPLQNYLFEMLVSLGEQLKGEPL